MPWINVEDCNGCGICVEECPVNTISLNDEEAEIEINGSIRCCIVIIYNEGKHEKNQTMHRI